MSLMELKLGKELGLASLGDDRRESVPIFPQFIKEEAMQLVF